MEEQVKNNKQASETQEGKASPEDKKSDKKPEKRKMDLTIFLLLLIPGIIKDIIEIVLGLIPGINFFVWLISLPFAAYIFFISIIAGMRKDLILIGQFIDLFPLASILPVTTITIIFCAFYQRAVPTSIKQPLEQIAKKTTSKTTK